MHGGMVPEFTGEWCLNLGWNDRNSGSGEI